MAEKVKALLIFEILGKPPEHIVITLEQLIDRLGENKGIKVTDRKVHEPHPVERKDDKGDIIDKVEGLFSTFAEVEVEVEKDLGLNSKQDIRKFGLNKLRLQVIKKHIKLN